MINRRNLFPRAALVMAAAILLTLGLACGGGSNGEKATATPTPDTTGGVDASPQLKAYYASIQTIFDTANSASDELSTAFDEKYSAATTVEEARDTLISYLSDTSSINSKSLDDLRGVSPPDEVKDKHQAFVDAGQKLLDIATELNGRLQDVTTEEEFNAVSDEFDTKGSDAAQAVNTACDDLQGVADDAQIQVDLQCGG
jgi:hypothetical protein